MTAFTGPFQPGGRRRTALVCFTGETDLPWLRLLRPGYRHCYAILHYGDRWILYNPLSHRTDLTILPDESSESLRHRLDSNGLTVAETVCRTDTPATLAPVFPYSCVEAVKRILGIQARGVRTPFQLHRHIKEQTMNF